MTSTRSYGSLRPERLFALAELNWCINNTRRGRCPHRPGRTNCFFDNFWRIRNFPMGRCGHRPLRTLTKNFKSAVGASLIGGYLNNAQKARRQSLRAFAVYWKMTGLCERSSALVSVCSMISRSASGTRLPPVAQMMCVAFPSAGWSVSGATPSSQARASCT